MSAKLTTAEMDFLDQCFADETGFLNDGGFSGTEHQRAGFLSSLARKGVLIQESADLFYLADDYYERYLDGGYTMRSNIISYVSDRYGFTEDRIVPLESDDYPREYCLFQVAGITYKSEDDTLTIVGR